MRRSHLETLGLLPGLGLFGCAAASAQLPGPDARLDEAPLPAIEDWRESASPVDPLTSTEAARLSSELALAAHDYSAAKAHLAVALDYAPGADALRLATADAHFALGELDAAESALREIGYGDELVSDVTTRRLMIGEARHDLGEASCDASVTHEASPLQRHADFLSVWNELRAQLPAEAALTIPADDFEAYEQLCVDDCNSHDVYLVRLDGEGESIVGLVVEPAYPTDGELWLLPALARPQTDSCSDELLIGAERTGDLVHLRSISDTREPPKTEDWQLGLEAELGRIQGRVASAGSSGYYAAGSGYASSGYASSGYASSGYYYGCGGGYSYYDDYGYYDDLCEPVRGVERDVFIDTARGEVVLDIVRTGPADAALGRVTVEHGRVAVEACGVEQSLNLSWTEA